MTACMFWAGVTETAAMLLAIVIFCAAQVGFVRPYARRLVARERAAADRRTWRTVAPLLTAPDGTLSRFSGMIHASAAIGQDVRVRTRYASDLPRGVVRVSIEEGTKDPS